MTNGCTYRDDVVVFQESLLVACKKCQHHQDEGGERAEHRQQPEQVGGCDHLFAAENAKYVHGGVCKFALVKRGRFLGKHQHTAEPGKFAVERKRATSYTWSCITIKASWLPLQVISMPPRQIFIPMCVSMSDTTRAALAGSNSAPGHDEELVPLFQCQVLQMTLDQSVVGAGYTCASKTTLRGDQM